MPDQLERVAAERAGSRWIYAEPTEDQVKEWFEQQPLHEGMQHGPYLGGIVVIPQTEEAKITLRKADGGTFVRVEERAAFTPYVKVDTRIRYFRDYVDVLNDAGDREYVGVIRPAAIPRITDPTSAFFNGNLPDGFSVHAVRNANDTIKRFILATFEVLIYERQSWRESRDELPPNPVLQGRGVKQVPTNYRNGWADDAALMKAETGAIGRALGVAGILVVGTGVASAEDIQEAVSGVGGAVSASEPALPPVVDKEGAPVAAEAVDPAAGEQAAIPAEQTTEQPPEDPEAEDVRLRALATRLRAELEATDPEKWAAYVEWWTGRNFGKLEDLKGPALKGAVVKLERDLDAAKGTVSG